MWPIPWSLQTGTSFVKLASSFDIVVNGISSPPRDLTDAIARTKSHLTNDKLERLVVGRGATDRSGVTKASSLTVLTLSLTGSTSGAVSSIMDEATKPIGTRVEDYSLTIPADGGSASITAKSTLGLFRGLTTFEQLFYFDGNDAVYTYQAPVAIKDKPAYPYRGFMLDTARNFFPVSDIKRTLDAMSSVKMSQFHWHVVDSHSFPLDVAGFSELSQKGAYSSSQIYSSSDVDDIVKYAGARGIDVLVEIDTPGHTAIIAESHPEHIACAGATPWGSFAAEPPAGQLRIASAKTITFATNLLVAVAKVFPSQLFSTGGDEVNLNCYKRDKETQVDLQANGKTIAQAVNYFTQTTHAALKKMGKTVVVWEEMVLNHNLKPEEPLSTDTIIQVWRPSPLSGPSSARRVVDKDYRIIHSPSDYFYLDCGQGSWVGQSPDRKGWCDFRTWQKAYTFNPQADIPSRKSHLILGGQQLLWSEQSDPSNLDSIVWPRAAVSAEIFWSGSTLADGTKLAVGPALARLHDLRYRLVQRGVKAIALQPHWCALRPGSSDASN